MATLICSMHQHFLSMLSSSSARMELLSGGLSMFIHHKRCKFGRRRRADLTAIFAIFSMFSDWHRYKIAVEFSHKQKRGVAFSDHDVKPFPIHHPFCPNNLGFVGSPFPTQTNKACSWLLLIHLRCFKKKELQWGVFFLVLIFKWCLLFQRGTRRRGCCRRLPTT